MSIIGNIIENSIPTKNKMFVLFVGTRMIHQHKMFKKFKERLDLHYIKDKSKIYLNWKLNIYQ